MHSCYIIDIGFGNIGSVTRMLSLLGWSCNFLQSPPTNTVKCPIIFPGVGHFSYASQKLDLNWRAWLNFLHLSNHPILAICLGAQLMCEGSDEGAGKGLGWINNRVRRFSQKNNTDPPLRVPHMGWRPFTPPRGCLPFCVPAGRMYYAHSFYIEPTTFAGTNPYLLEYSGIPFAAVVVSNCVVGVQFHPEKSHAHGLAFFKAWLEWASELV